jgi:hypothetical protein
MYHLYCVSHYLYLENYRSEKKKAYHPQLPVQYMEKATKERVILNKANIIMEETYWVGSGDDVCKELRDPCTVHIARTETST